MSIWSGIKKSIGGNRRKGTPERSQVQEGSVSPDDEIRFMELDKSLVKEMIKDAKRAGRAELPNVRGPEPLEEPAALREWRNRFEMVCFSLKEDAAEQLGPTSRELKALAGQIKSGVLAGVQPTEDPVETQLRRQQLLDRFGVEEAKITEIEQVHEARLGQIESNFDTIAGRFHHELLLVHPDAKVLQERWLGPAKFIIPDAAKDFGQASARAVVADIDKFLKEGDE